MKSHVLPAKRAEPPKGIGESDRLKAKNESNRFNQRKTFGNSRTAGLPGELRHGIENLTGMTMDDVSVHYNSKDPARLDALAFAAGTNIYLGPGQERYLPHEAWHVVQQKSGRVQPTGELGGRLVNDDPALEHEADSWRTSLSASPAPAAASEVPQNGTGKVVQRVKGNRKLGGALGLAGAGAMYYLPGLLKLLGLPLVALGLYLGTDHETEGERRIREKLEKNEFRITAGLDQYEKTFHEGFLDDLKELGENDRWLDGGAGSAVAINDFYTKLGGKAKTVAVGYQKPETKTVQDLEKKQGFRYASGKFFGDMERGKDLGLQNKDDRLQLITDYNGVLTYTKTLSEDLQKYLDLLAVGGSIYTWLIATIQPYTSNEPELEWLEEAIGVEVTRIEPHTYKIRKTKENAWVRPLKSIAYEARDDGTNPPDRVFRVS